MSPVFFGIHQWLCTLLGRAKISDQKPGPTNLGSTKRGFSKRGFTLTEILIVLSLIGFIVATIAPRLADRRTKIKSAVRHLVVTVRDARSSAKLFNMTARLVLDFNKKEGHRFWVETGQPNAVLLTAEQEEEEKRKTSFEKEEDQDRKTTFTMDSRITKREFLLPKDIFFDRVEYAGRDKPLTDGQAYIYFFPMGLSQEATIHISDKKSLNWTIYISALGGKMELLEGDKSLKDIVRQ